MFTRREAKKLNSMADDIYRDCCLMNLKKYGNQEAVRYMRETVSRKAGKYRNKRLSGEAKKQIDIAESKILLMIPSYVKETREMLGYGEPRKPRKFTKTRRLLNKYGKVYIPPVAAASVPAALLLNYKITGNSVPVESIYSLIENAFKDIPSINLLPADPFKYVTVEMKALREMLPFAGLGLGAGAVLDSLSGLFSAKRKEEQYGRLKEELKKALEI